MALYDQHLHSRHSNDSDADPADNVRRALELGLSGLTFTEHYDTHPSEWHLCKYNYEKIASTVAALRTEFGSRIFIGHGIEICYQPENMGPILDYLDAHSFDLVLLSVHWFAGRALHVREHWDGLDPSQGTRLYLESTLEAARLSGRLRQAGRRVFDVLGHLDLVKRYTQRYFGMFDIRPHAALVDEILRACLESDLVPEVNCSTLRQQLPEPSPAEWVVQHYAELGGRAMTLGSDAHRTADIGAGLHDSAAMLKRCGITHVAVFKGRQRENEPL